MLNLKLITFGCECVVFGALFTLSIFNDATNYEDKYTSSECKINIAFVVVYWMLWVTFLYKTVLTSYMNVKFSRSLQ